MSYAQRKEMSGNRTVAIIIVALIHIALGYAIVTGLAYNMRPHSGPAGRAEMRLRERSVRPLLSRSPSPLR